MSWNICRGFALSVQVLGPELPSSFAACQSVMDSLLLNYSYVVKKEQRVGTFLVPSTANVTMKMILLKAHAREWECSVEQNVPAVHRMYSVSRELHSSSGGVGFFFCFVFWGVCFILFSCCYCRSWKSLEVVLVLLRFVGLLNEVFASPLKWWWLSSVEVKWASISACEAGNHCRLIKHSPLCS